MGGPPSPCAGGRPPGGVPGGSGALGPVGGLCRPMGGLCRGGGRLNGGGGAVVDFILENNGEGSQLSNLSCQVFE